MATHSWPLLGIFCAVVALASGCSTQMTLTPSNCGVLAGKYVLDWEPWAGRKLGRETLVLRANGTYRQVFVTPNGIHLANEGDWACSDVVDGMLYLSDWKRYVRPTYTGVDRRAERGSFTLPVYRHGKRITLVVDDDLGLHYTRVP